MTRWAAMMVAGVLVFGTGCRVARVQEVGVFDQSDAVLARDVSVLNWNIQKSRDAAVAGELAEVADAWSPDLILLQEVREDIATLQGYGAVFAPAWRYPWAGSAARGVMTISRVPPIEVEAMASRKREPAWTAPKMALATLYGMAEGEPLLAVNVHCLNFQRFTTRKFRDQLGELEAVIGAHEGPVVFAGDFNTWSRKRLTILTEMAERVGVEEIEGFPAGRKTGAQSPAFLNGLLGIDPALVLDRIFVRGFDVKDAEVFPDGSSDHRAMGVRLRLAGPE
ncbi:MAG: endonuclease/exonuclease/phosphatase family protein [Verrucomicrobiota bacterium]